jgi:RNA polymerase-binding transcription factor
MGKAIKKRKTKKSKTRQEEKKSKKNKPLRGEASPQKIKKPTGRKQQGGIVLKSVKKLVTKAKEAGVKQPSQKTDKSDWKGEMRDMLLQMRKELLEDVSQTVKAESDYLRFDVGDFYDHASSDRDRELSLTLSDRERDKLRLIDEALKMIDDGSYGTCESCGDEIGEDRLRAMPLAKLCLACKIDLERQESRNI